MLCGNKPFQNNAVKHMIPNPTPVAPGVKFPKSLKTVLKKSVAFKPEDRYQNFTEMRHALNDAYTDAFKTACPYAELSNVDLRADSLNNRAVSLFELGEGKEAVACLNKTLEINDGLPEAVYNLILLKWRSGRVKPQRILRQIDAAQKRGIVAPWFSELEAALKHSMVGDKIDSSRKNKYPEFRLCIPKNSLEIFREGQLHLSVQRNIMDHLENKRYESCYNVLSTAWENTNFRKDKVFNKAYDTLLRFGKKKKVLGAQRFLTLHGLGSAATNLAYIPSSKKIVFSGADGKIMLRDFSANKKKIIISEDKVPVTAIAACPKGKHIVVGNADGETKLLYAKTGKPTSEKIKHNGQTYACTFDLEGRHVASGGSDGILKILKLSTGVEKSISLQDGGGVTAVTYINKELDMVTGSEDGKIRFWEAGGNECLRIIEAHAMPIIAISVSSNQQRFVTASSDRSIKIWEHRTGRCLKTIRAHEEDITSVLFLPDNKTIVSGCVDDTIKLWDIDRGKCLCTLDGRGDGILSLGYGPKPHTFLSGRKDGGIVLWMIIYDLEF
jgi:WD40 repeat protein